MVVRHISTSQYYEVTGNYNLFPHVDISDPHVIACVIHIGCASFALGLNLPKLLYTHITFMMTRLWKSLVMVPYPASSYSAPTFASFKDSPCGVFAMTASVAGSCRVEIGKPNTSSTSKCEIEL